MKKSKFPYLVLAPMLALLTLFTAVPIIGSFAVSLMDYNPLREQNTFVGLQNFQKLLGDEVFQKSFWNTIYFVIVSTIVNLVVTLAIAQLLVTLRSNRWRSTFRVTFFMPCVAPLAAMSIVWMRSVLPVKGGLLNMGLGLLSIPAINWLGSPGYLMTSIIILTLWADIGYNIILFISGIQGIPTDYFEAAEIDGAGPLRRFFNMTLPLMNRTFTFVLVMTIISQFQAFAQFSILAKEGGPNYGAYVMSTHIYYVGFRAKDMGYASAISIALFAVIMLATLIERRLTRVDWGY